MFWALFIIITLNFLLFRISLLSHKMWIKLIVLQRMIGKFCLILHKCRKHDVYSSWFLQEPVRQYWIFLFSTLNWHLSKTRVTNFYIYNIMFIICILFWMLHFSPNIWKVGGWVLMDKTHNDLNLIGSMYLSVQTVYYIFIHLSTSFLFKSLVWPSSWCNLEEIVNKQFMLLNKKKPISFAVNMLKNVSSGPVKDSHILLKQRS